MEILAEDPKYMNRKEARELRQQAYNAAIKIYGEDWREYLPERAVLFRPLFWDYVMTPREHLLLQRIIRQAESYPGISDNGRPTQ